MCALCASAPLSARAAPQPFRGEYHSHAPTDAPSPLTTQDAFKEVNLSHVRNKALEKLGLGLSQTGPTAASKPWVSAWKPWFPSPDTELEYREAAYALNRRDHALLLRDVGVAYLLVAVIAFTAAKYGYTSFVEGEGVMTSTLIFILRMVAVAYALTLGVVTWFCPDLLGPRQAMVLSIVMVLLMAVVRRTLSHIPSRQVGRASPHNPSLGRYQWWSWWRPIRTRNPSS